jgi:hypothetical protein
LQQKTSNILQKFRDRFSGTLKSGEFSRKKLVGRAKRDLKNELFQKLSHERKPKKEHWGVDN